ncbi:MAG: prepilin-type N-terminal cleavage/methylation domain-containing protein [Candidatus Contendobacter sp.]
MPMLATCRRAEPVRGYTLLELLIVLALLGLLTALAIPRFAALYQGMSAAYQRDEALRQIAGLGYRAFAQGREWVLTELPATDAALPSWPEGWSLRAEPPVHYYRNGACSGGRIELTHPGGVERFALAPPLCQPQASDG